MIHTYTGREDEQTRMPKDKRVTLCDPALSGIHHFMADHPDVKTEGEVINIACFALQRTDIGISINNHRLANKGKLYQVPVDPKA